MVVPEGYVLVPIEPTSAVISAMMTSQARDDEGLFPMLMDILNYSGQNKAHTVLREAYRAAMLAAQKEPK